MTRESTYNVGMSTPAALIHAVKNGDADAVRALLAQDPALANAKDTDGTSAVLLASYHGAREIQKLLLAAGPPLSAFEAAATGDETALMALVRADPVLLNSYSHDGFTALQLGAFFSHADIVKFCLAGGADVNAVSRNPMALRALHSAAAAGHIPISKLLLANGADVNARQSGGFTALHAAAQNGSLALTRLLLEWDADPALATDDGKTARDFAIADKHCAVLGLLDAHALGASVRHDLPYVSGGHARQKLDLYLPAGHDKGAPLPLIVSAARQPEKTQSPSDSPLT